MRIRALDLIAFGPFARRTLRFDHDGAVELVYGPNEAGKSTTRRAILGLLFGIPERSRDGYAVDEMRVGATLVADDGRALEVLRRKGRKNTLLSPSEEPLDPAVLTKLLGGVDLDTYTRVYGLNHDELSSGGDALRIGQGDVGESLFSAATGLTVLHELLVRQREEAENLFVPLGKQRPFNEAHRAYTDAKKRVAELATSPDKWVEQQRRIKQAREDLQRLHDARGEQRGRLDAARAAAEAARVAATHRARAVELERELGLVRAELQTLAPSAALLDRAEAIGLLQQRLGTHKKDQLERPRVVANLASAEERLVRARRGGAATGTGVAAARVRKLAREGASLRERGKQLEARAAEAAGLVEQARRAVATLAPSADLESLRAAAPAPESVRLRSSAVRGLAERGRKLQEEQRRLRDERTEAERLVAIARAEGDVPSEEALASARAARDAQWEALRDAGEAPAARAAARYERAVHAADELGDRLRREADRVSRLREAEAALDAAQRKLAANDDDTRTLAEEQRAAAEAWEALWKPLGVPAGAPEEMAGWYARWETSVAAAERLALDALRKREDVARDRSAYEREASEHAGEWRAVTEALRLPMAADAEEVEAAIGAREALLRVEEELGDLQRRLETIDRDAERFTEDVRSILHTAAPDLAAAPVEEACAELARRLGRASEQRTRREMLEDQERKLALQREAVRAAVGHDDAGVSPELEEERASQLEAQMSELTDRIEQTRGHLGSLEAGAKEFPQSPTSEDAAKAQQELARLRDVAERYVRARLGAAALARGGERYRRENQGAGLERASALFAALTLGAFAGLEVGFAEGDEPVILAIRSGQRLGMTALSEGTRDQLYLALRVASLERASATRGPLPLLLDDVLVHFDDQRAAAALAVLSELAKRTQVILFTHHQRIVDIARGALHDRDGTHAVGIHDLGAA